jgi:hypothetical protein
MEEYGIDIMFITETWARVDSRAPHSLCRAYTPFPLLGNAKLTGRNSYGTSFMINPKYASSDILKVLDSGIAGLSSKVRWNDIELCGVYLPPFIETEKCIQILESVIQEGDGYTVLMGDFNMRVGEDLGDTKWSKRGKELTIWLNERGLTLCPPSSPAPTCEPRPGTTSMVDMIWMSNNLLEKWAGTQVQQEAIGGSDHRAVMATVSISRAIQTPTPEYQRYATSRLENEDTLNTYRRVLQSLLENTQREAHAYMVPNWVDKLETDITTAIHTAALQTMGRVKIKPHCTKLSTPKLKAIRKKRKKQFAKYSQEPDEFRKLMLWEEYRAICRQEKHIFKEELTKRYETFNNNLHKKLPHEQMKVVRNIKNSRMRSTEMALDNDATAMMSHHEYFQSLYTDHSIIQEGLATQLRESALDPEPAPFTLASVTCILDNLTKGKAAGGTGITAELISRASSQLAPLVLQLFTGVWESGLCPTSWTQALIHPVFKKGNKTEISNYRPISLTETLRKAFERSLLPALTDSLEPLSIYQGGFRKKRSTIDQVACLHDAIQLRKVKLRKWPTVAFLDIKAAYDTVNREILWKKLETGGCGKTMLRTLRVLFDFNRSRLVIRGVRSGEITLNTGLLQGSILSPILYTKYIDDLADDLALLGRGNLGGTPIAGFFYADDIAIVADDSQHLQQLLQVCEHHSFTHHYRFAPSKCAVVPQCGVSTTVALYGVDLPHTNSFIYLGIPMKKEGIDRDEHVRKRGIAFDNSVRQLRSMGMHGRGWTLSTRRTIFQSFLRPQLEYGIPLLRVSHCDKLQVTMNGGLRTCLSMPPSTSSNAILALMAIDDIHTSFSVLQARWRNRAENAPSQFLISKVWKSFSQKKTRSSTMFLTKPNQCLVRYEEEMRLQHEGQGQKRTLKTLTQIHRQARWKARWTDTTVSSTIPQPSKPTESIRQLDSLQSRISTWRVTRWMLGRPYHGKPLKCVRCPENTAKKVHIMLCSGLDINRTCRTSAFPTADIEIKVGMRHCLLDRVSSTVDN